MRVMCVFLSLSLSVSHEDMYLCVGWSGARKATDNGYSQSCSRISVCCANSGAV